MVESGGANHVRSDYDGWLDKKVASVPGVFLMSEDLTDEYEASVGGEGDREGRLEVDVYCVHCEYNLRGAKASGACPECGASVAESLEERTLMFAPSEYLKVLRTGFLWLLVSYVLGMLVMGVGFLVNLFTAYQGRAGIQGIHGSQMVLMVIGLLPIAVYVFGALKVLMSHQYGADATRSRVTGHYAMIVVGVATVLGVVMHIGLLAGSVTPGIGVTIARTGMGIVNTVALLVAAYTLAYYVCRFQTGMPFSPHRSFRWLPGFVLFVQIIPIIISFISLWIMLQIQSGTPFMDLKGFLIINAIIGGISGLLMLIAAIMNIVLYSRLLAAVGGILGDRV
ncbi:hypothetical protein JD969_13845 [Planctomycetota bacterium]|nr:hypothetical protein JD969_13845 [Planctomycetota bacterium]